MALKITSDFGFSSISKISCFLDTEDVVNSYFKMIRLYNVLRKISYLSKAEETEVIESQVEITEEPEENAGLNKALDTYRKLIEKKDGVEALTEKEQEDLERETKTN